jgi:hypothetical protein
LNTSTCQARKIPDEQTAAEQSGRIRIELADG